MEKVGERMADISTEELERIEREYHSGSDNIKPIQEFSKPEDLYDELIASIRKYHPSTDITLIEKAYHVAFEAHKGQVRKSGEAYIIHPLCVAIILAELELDKETIAAGLLHDVLEDTVMTEEQMREEFGDEVLLLVDGVTKLQHLHLTDNIKNPKDKNADRLEMQAENLRKMFLAMAKDIRVIMIKLADRLHNMRTLKYQSRRHSSGSPVRHRRFTARSRSVLVSARSRLNWKIFLLNIWSRRLTMIWWKRLHCAKMCGMPMYRDWLPMCAGKLKRLASKRRFPDVPSISSPFIKKW